MVALKFSESICNFISSCFFRGRTIRRKSWKFVGEESASVHRTDIFGSSSHLSSHSHLRNADLKPLRLPNENHSVDRAKKNRWRFWKGKNGFHQFEFKIEEPHCILKQKVLSLKKYDYFLLLIRIYYGTGSVKKNNNRYL